MAQKKPKQGAEYVLSPHLGLLMPLTNSVKAGKNAYKNPRQTPPSWVPFIVYIELN